MKKNTALKIAINAMKDLRARKHVVGHNAYQDGVKERWTEIAHKEYVKLSKAMEVLEAIRGQGVMFDE